MPLPPVYSQTSYIIYDDEMYRFGTLSVCPTNRPVGDIMGRFVRSNAAFTGELLLNYFSAGPQRPNRIRMMGGFLDGNSPVMHVFPFVFQRALAHDNREIKERKLHVQGRTW